MKALRAAVVAAFAMVSGAALAQPYAPPPPPADLAPVVPAPGTGFVLVPGHWVWNGVRYTWAPAHWVARVAGFTRWVPGHWVVRPRRGWRWIEGHWVR